MVRRYCDVAPSDDCPMLHCYNTDNYDFVNQQCLAGNSVADSPSNRKQLRFSAAPITPASLSTSRPAAVAVLTRALVRTTTAPRAAVRPCLRQDGAFWGWALATQPSCSKQNSKSTKTGTGNHIYSYPVNQVPHPPSAAALMRATERWQLTGLPSHP